MPGFKAGKARGKGAPGARAKSGGGGNCGTGKGGFKAGNTCGTDGGPRSRGHPLGDARTAIKDAPERSGHDRARDHFSSAKADHAKARLAQRAAPTPENAARLAAARATLGRAREGYREAGGGKIEPRPLDSHDPRVKAIRESRPGTQWGREVDPSAPRREHLEDRVLVRTPSPLAVRHHYGEKAPPIAPEDVAATRKAARRYEAGKPATDEELPHVARYADQRASALAGEKVGRSYLVYDRRTGNYDYSHNDYQLRISPKRHESFRSGRLEVLKAYGKDGREIPVDRSIRDHLRVGPGG